MEIGETLLCTTRAEWRAWLEEHHGDKREIWLITYKKGSGKQSVDYDAAVDEAVCFGWIDGIIKGVNEEYYAARWSPRRKRSNWTEANRERARRMTVLGLMTPAGLEALPADLRAELTQDVSV